MASLFGTDDSPLAIEVRQEKGATIVTTRGEVTVFSSAALRTTLRRAAEARPPLLVLDLSGTVYIDSSGVATIVEALQTVQGYKGRLVLAGVTPRVRGTFEIVRLDRLFVMVGSVGEALAS
ncbi:MAG: STAS domain-containing protein [Planctomycetota bacterium]|nr:STAS domain-containing protein [Planctomycetota bacterium]